MNIYIYINKSMVNQSQYYVEEIMSLYPNRKNCKYVVYLQIKDYESAYGRLTIYKNFSLIHSMEIYLLDLSKDLDLSKPYLAMKLNIVEKNKPIYEILQLNNNNGDETGKGIVSSRINNQRSFYKNAQSNDEKSDFVVFKRIYSEKENDSSWDDDDDDSDVIEYKLCIL
jgi:hypothetical protein